jgi:hypothetical protein
MINILSVVIQVVIVLIIIISLNLIAVAIMTKEKIIEDPSEKTVVPIFRGWIDTNGFTNKKFNTHNRFAKNYRSLPRSVNFDGGAQYSYSFWMKLNNVSSENVSRKILFMQGDPEKYHVNVKENGKSYGYKHWVVKNPMIGFGDGIEEIEVEFNTTEDLNAKSVIKRKKSDDETLRRNVLSLIPSKWALFTFVFKDNQPMADFENGVLFEFYINDVQHHREFFKGGLRLNNGNIVILPTGSIKDGFISDLTYYNYALTDYDVMKVYNKGFTNERFNEMDNDADFNEPLYLTKYNKLEIHNLNNSS